MRPDAGGRFSNRKITSVPPATSRRLVVTIIFPARAGASKRMRSMTVSFGVRSTEVDSNVSARPSS